MHPSRQRLAPNCQSLMPAALTVMAVLILSATGCGGGGESAPAAGAPAPAATPPTVTSPAPAADTTPPTVSIGSSAAGSTASGDITFTFTFSEDVGSSFTTEDLVVTGGSKGTFARLSGTLATLVVVPTPNAVGTVNLNIAAAAFADAAANTSVGTAFAAQAYNTSVASTGLSYIAQPHLVSAQGAVTQSAYNQATGRAQAGQYETGFYAAPAMNWWWGGTYKEKIQSGYGVSSTDISQGYFGVYIKHGGSGWDISAASTYSFRLGTNGDCAGRCSATVRLVSTESPNCVADVKVALTAAAVSAYARRLADFTVSGCSVNSLAAFKQSKVAELHYQMLRADMQFAAGNSDTANPGLYPNGLDMGGSIGFDAPTGAPAPVADPVVNGPAFTSLTFDDLSVTYLNTDFGGVASSILLGPVNGDGRVLRSSKLAGAEQWAGTTLSTGADFSIAKIPFTASAKTMTLRVWAPAAGMKIRLKVEDATDVTKTCETDATTTVANAWQTLTFNFANAAFNNGDPSQATAPLNLASTFTKVSVFPNYGTPGAVAGYFYFDDLRFVP